MNKIPRTPDGGLAYDGTLLSRFTSCPRLFYYNQIQKKRLVRSTAALDFGTAIHLAMEFLYTRTMGNKISQEDKDSLIKHWNEELSLPLDGNDYRNANYGAQLLSFYCDAFSDEQFEVQVLGGKPLIERRFFIPLGEVQGTKVYWWGKIDLGIRQPNGEVCHLDFKTSSRLEGNFASNWSNDQSQLGYAWALSHLLNQEVTGFWMCALSTRKPKANGDINFECPRVPVYIAPGRLEEWRVNTLEIIEEMLHLESTGKFPMHRHSCIGKYGPCEFKNVCDASAHVRDKVLASAEYETETWTYDKKD